MIEYYNFDDMIEKEEENSEESIPLTERKLITEKSDRTLFDLVRMISNGALNLSPEYQRSFVWNLNQQSRFIESILLGIPVPTIFISENPNSTFEVVDGQQRLTTLSRFFNNELKLKNLSALPEFTGKNFEDLDTTTKNVLENTRTMPVISILKDSTPGIKFDIFQRINEGAVKLSPQELRNVVFRGPVIESLHKLGNFELFNNLFNPDSNTVKRLQHHEIILRMLSMEELLISEEDELVLPDAYNGRLNTAMMLFLEKYRYSGEDLVRIEEEFEDTMKKILYVIPEEKVFRIFNLQDGEQRTRLISKPVAEFEYILFKNLSWEYIENNKTYLLNTLSNIYRENLILFQRATANRITVEGRLYLINDVIKNGR